MTTTSWNVLGELVKPVSTIVGTAFGNPLLGRVAGELLAEGLGVEATPEAVAAAIDRDPGKAAVVVREIERQKIKEWAPYLIEADTGAMYAQEGQDLDDLSGFGKQLAVFGRVIWRPFAAIVFTVMVALLLGVLLYLMAKGELAVLAAATTLLNTMGALALIAGMFGVMGVYVHGRSREKRAKEAT